MKLGFFGTILFIFLLLIQSYSSYKSSSISRNNIKDSRLIELADRTNINIIKEDIEKISIVRIPDTPSHKTIQQYIINEINSYTYWNLQTHTFISNTPYGDKEFTNIIATWSPLPHSKDKFKQAENEKRIILSAHYDSKLFDYDFLAATDSAVSCALLLDLMRSLDKEFEYYATHKSVKINTQLSLQIIFFDGEEAFIDWTNTDSLYGSKELAKKWKESDNLFHIDPLQSTSNRKREGLDNIELFILFDLIGAKDPIPQFYSYFEETNDPFLHFSNLESRLVKNELYDISNIPLHRINNPYISSKKLPRKYRVDDDHKHFLNNNVPVIHFIPYGFPKVWHTIDDNLSAIDYNQVYNWSILLRCWVADYFNFH